MFTGNILGIEISTTINYSLGTKKNYKKGLKYVIFNKYDSTLNHEILEFLIIDTA